MKIAFVTIVVLGFVGVAVFGFIFMNHENGYSHGGCIASLAKGVNCPVGISALDYISFHFNVFQNLSMAIFGGGVLSALLFFVALILLVLNIQSPQLQLALKRKQASNSFFSPQKQGLIYWLALHENSPAVL